MKRKKIYSIHDGQEIKYLILGEDGKCCFRDEFDRDTYLYPQSTGCFILDKICNFTNATVCGRDAVVFNLDNETLEKMALRMFVDYHNFVYNNSNAFRDHLLGLNLNQNITQTYYRNPTYWDEQFQTNK